jgi:hypothetical protein
MIESFASRDSVQLPPSKLKNNRLLTCEPTSSVISTLLLQRVSFFLLQLARLQFTSVYYFSLMNYANKTDETQWVAELATATDLMR